MSEPNHPFNPRDHDNRIPTIDLSPSDTKSRDDETDSRTVPWLRSSSLYANPPSPAFYPRMHLGTEERFANPENISDLARSADFKPDIPILQHSDQPVLDYRACHPYRGVTPLSGPADLNSAYNAHWLQTPPPMLPDQFSTRFDINPSDLVYPLSELPPRVLRVVNPDPASSDESDECKEEFKATHAQEYNTSAKLTAAVNEKQKLKIDLQDMTRKLETAFRDSRMNERKQKTMEKKWCSIHLAMDTCEAKEREGGTQKPPSAPERLVTKAVGNVVLPPKPGQSISLLKKPSLTETKAPIVDKVANEGAKTIPGNGSADPNRFLDFVDRQRVSRAMYNQNCARLCDEALRKQDVQRAKREQMVAEVSKIETQWQSEVNKISTELRHVEKKVQASSRLPVRGKSMTPKCKPSNGPVKASKEKPDAPDTAQNSVTSRSAITQNTDAAAAKHKEGLKSGPEPRKLSFFRDPLSSCLTAEQESAAGPERTTSRTRHIAARLAAEADSDSKWDNVELSADEDWEKVEGDEGGDWEVV
ncbi:hypothetical protein EJ07DRAFT_152718 [Lizonia empirigonia]|nr:hypothetical protein EJ07DRAFT_152718 [Lizonia empirigonia]